MIARHLNFALLALLIAVAPVRAGACALVAVASNFAPTAQALARAWAGQGGCMPRFSAASTGQLYAQALAGAPFDLLLAADVERPAALAERLGLPAPRIYALGRLAAVTAHPGGDARTTLLENRFRVLALADPATAPYGRAAAQVLAALDLEVGPDRRATAANVAQAYGFVVSGAAEVGLVALSLVRVEDRPRAWIVPDDLHAPIAQAAVVLGGSGFGSRFLDFMASDEGAAILQSAGYGLPAADG